MRLIDADALIETVHDMTHHPDNYLTVREIEDTVEREPTIGCWVSVKDRLPENGVLVLVAYAVDYGLGMTMTIVDTAMHQSFGFCGGGYDNFRACNFCNTEVTHWMPLPEPPKEVSGDG